jgi:hypothetical protein
MKKLITIFLLTMAIFAGCHDDDAEEEGVKGIKFQEETKLIYVGDAVTIAVEILGNKSKSDVSYKASREGIIEITGSSKEGVILEGKKRGTVVITAECSGYSAYCNITVGGSDEKLIPHILSPFTVLEVPLNSRRSVTVTLAGGTPIDNSNFIWSVENGSIFGSIEYTGSVCVFETAGRGEAKLTVRHPKAKYGVDILVFVTDTDEKPVYITSEKTVLDLKKEDGAYQFKVRLIGSDREENYGFIYEVVEGQDVVQLAAGNTDTLTVIPKKGGIALIKVSHQKAAYSYEVQAVVTEELEYKYMETSKSFIMMGKDKEEIIIVNFKGEAQEDLKDKYSFTLSESDIVFIYNAQEVFYIRSLKEGKTVLTIENEYADFAREILIIVGNEEERMSSNEKYITTSQNVITMEAGGADVILDMLLVGGNEADRNSFTWYVEDSSVIDVNAEQNGIVVNNRLPQGRAMINNVVYEEFKGRAIISPKKAGTSKIVIEHQKAKNDMVVLVKVYPKNTFGEVPLVLSGSPYYRIGVGEELEVNLFVQTGKYQSLGNVEWSVADNKVAEVTKNSGLEGALYAKKKGITELKVSGGNLKSDFRALLIIAPREELDGEKFIYVMNPVISLMEGHSVVIPIIGVNVDREEIKDLSFGNSDNDVLGVMLSNGELGIIAKSKGLSEIVISGEDTNILKINVLVEGEKLTAGTPFYIGSSESITGLVKGSEKFIEVNLIGGTEKDESGISWYSGDEKVVKITGNGKRVRLEAKGEGQTVIKAGHGRSQNTLSIAVYVVLSESDLNNKVAFFVEKNNYLIQRGEKIIISVKTNAKDSQKGGITWSIDNSEVIDIEVGVDKAAAIISGRKAGVSRILISHVENIISQAIYVSVTGDGYNVPYIGVPSIIEAVVEKNINITAVTVNMGEEQKSLIKWSSGDEKIAVVAGNGVNCYVQPLRSGQTVITAKHEGLGLEKRILIYVYESYAQMSNSYLISAEQSYYRISEGDIIEASLVFGSKGFPEHEINNIRWSVEDNNVVRINGNGRKARIEAVNLGVAKIRAQSDVALNSYVEIEVEVMEKTYGSDEYWISVNAQDKINGIVKGAYKDITVNLYKGLTQINTGLDLITFESSDSGKIGISSVNNFARITAKENGSGFVTIKYKEAAEKIFVYITGSEAELSGAYPIFFDRNNYLIKKGEVRKVEIRTIDNDMGKIGRITVENIGGEIINVAKSVKEISIEGVKKGNGIISVLYDGVEKERLYVSVTESQEAEITTYLGVEEIAGILEGQTYELKASTNLSEEMKGYIRWETEGSGNVDLLNNLGDKAVIKGLSAGKEYVTVKSGSIERKILVCVCLTENELRNLKALNIAQRYFIINEGQSLNIKLQSYDGKYEGVMLYSDNYEYEEKYAGIIEEVEKRAGMIIIKGAKEGIACIRIKNAFYNFDELIYAEVRKNQLGGIQNVFAPNYITADRTLYVMEEGEKNDYVSVRVVGDDFNQYAYFAWEETNLGIIDLEVLGNYAVVKALKKGETKVIVRNVYCENSVELVFIVGDKYEVETAGVPYIYAKNTINEYRIGDGEDIILYEIRNESKAAMDKYKFVENGNSVRLDVTSYGKIVVKVLRAGITRSRLQSEDGGIYLDFYFIVREGELSGAVYLTTGDNYIITGLNEISNADIRLEGYFEADSGKFEWDINDKSVARVIGNGTRGQIYPLKEGVAEITVRHFKANFPLKINLKVLKNAGEKAIYLTTTDNVIETAVSNVLNYVYVQKIGGDVSKRICTWSVDDSSIISLTGNEFTGSFIAKRAGTAKIKVENTEGYPLEIVVIVRELSGGNMYITAAESLIMMSPGSVNRRISVYLNGGADSDSTGFNWFIYAQFPSDIKIAQSNGNVLSIVGNGPECNINAINDGVAKLRVTHEKADNPLYITVYVTRYNNVAFPVTTKEMRAGTSEFMELKVPTYENFRENIYCVSDNAEVATVIFTDRSVLISAHKEGLAIIRARIGTNSEAAELYVTVKEDFDPDILRIITPRTSYSFNPRSNVEKLQATLTGIRAEELNDGLQWVLDESADSVISIFPTAARGSQIEITPRREGVCVITIKHNQVAEKYWKVIHIEVSESQNALTLNKTNVVIKGGMGQTVRAEIIGGRPRDYDEIVWMADWYVSPNGLEREILMIMGQGREIMAYPRNVEGTVKLWAYYRGFKAECLVTVELDAVFSIEYSSIRMNPGEEKTIKYSLKPDSQYVQWVVMGDEGGENLIDYEINDILKTIKIKSKNEGLVMLRGIAGTLLSSVNIIIKNNYQIQGDSNVKFEPSVAGQNGEKNVINFKVNPANTSIVVEGAGDLKYEIVMLQDGKGKIILKSDTEFLDRVITVRQKTAGQNPAFTNKSFQTLVSCYYDDNVKPTPYFVRYNGKFSNTTNPNGNLTEGQDFKGYENKTVKGEVIREEGGAYVINLGDGEDHYILFDKKYENSDLIIGEIMPILDDPLFEVKKEPFTQNGITYTAIRISGKEDYVEYDRVKYDHDLWVDVRQDGNIKIAEENYTTTGKYGFSGSSYNDTSNNYNTGYYYTYTFPGKLNYVLKKEGYVTGTIRINAPNDYSIIIDGSTYEGYGGMSMSMVCTIPEKYIDISFSNVKESLLENRVVNSQAGLVFYNDQKPITRLPDYTEINNGSEAFWHSESYRFEYFNQTGYIDYDNEFRTGRNSQDFYPSIVNVSYSGNGVRDKAVGRVMGIGGEYIGRTWLGNWSDKCCIAVLVNDYYVDGDTYGQQRIRWEGQNPSNKPILISELNSFPFKVNNVSCFNIEDPTGTKRVKAMPVPSRNRNVTEIKEETFTIPIRMINKSNESIVIKVRYERRKCHYMYDGDNDIEGITNWDLLEKRDENVYVKKLN